MLTNQFLYLLLNKPLFKSCSFPFLLLNLPSRSSCLSYFLPYLYVYLTFKVRVFFFLIILNQGLNADTQCPYGFSKAWDFLEIAAYRKQRPWLGSIYRALACSWHPTDKWGTFVGNKEVSHWIVNCVPKLGSQAFAYFMQPGFRALGLHRKCYWNKDTCRHLMLPGFKQWYKLELNGTR